jgi:hypothetical protein
MQEINIFKRKILSDDGYQIHIGKEARDHGKMRS